MKTGKFIDKKFYLDEENYLKFDNNLAGIPIVLLYPSYPLNSLFKELYQDNIMDLVPLSAKLWEKIK